MEETDSWKEGEIMVKRRGRDESKNIYEGPMDMDSGEGIDCGSGV